MTSPSLSLSRSAVARIARHARAFAGRVIHRQLPTASPADLWEPTSRPRRWNYGFPALYTSLVFVVAIAERVKRTLARSVELLMGVGAASIARVVDVALSDVRAALGASVEDLTTEDYTFTQQVGAALFRAGVTGLLVPSAIADTARLYPRFRFVRDGHVEIRPTPASGVNLVIFTDNFLPGDGYPETMRFICEIAGIPA